MDCACANVWLYFQVLYDVLKEVGADLRAVAKTKISDIARGDSKATLSHSTLSKNKMSNGIPEALRILRHEIDVK